MAHTGAHLQHLHPHHHHSHQLQDVLLFDSDHTELVVLHSEVQPLQVSMFLLLEQLQLSVSGKYQTGLYYLNDTTITSHQVFVMRSGLTNVT